MKQTILEKKDYLPFTVFVCGLVLLSAWFFIADRPDALGSDLENEVLPEKVVLPFEWGNLGRALVEAGVIDETKLDVSRYLEDEGVKAMVMTKENSGMWLNLLWAFGLANKNPILEQGPMAEYGDTGNFASTGGWTIAKGGAMAHYSKYEFVVLNEAQQALVERVSQGIFRPCCNNPTYFPDCNHGMAMLALLELMAASNVSEDEMYEVALEVNSYWFPGTYLTIAKYYEMKGIPWDRVDAREALGPNFSSASGYAKVLNEVEPVNLQGGGCGL
ncbi:MAG: hypothetical protein A2842_01760 [Candidatus Wildermuthbacteria bacterium RIFCSPHIGHO2_01_FULL_48_25]|nr:MAG: hypothetical protein A2842_01760 [Candidatus Wildermuthbacteria bacterium RIFCSPHIGHO2_01_FULL_48_25]OHA68493.1 MAG: hypothetical protein A3J57_02285 [Candidatus Wildermuthbacteria bacterium RIFCSPHIGHO2_02_FULL_49_12b]